MKAVAVASPAGALDSFASKLLLIGLEAPTLGRPRWKESLALLLQACALNGSQVADQPAPDASAANTKRNPPGQH